MTEDDCLTYCDDAINVGNRLILEVLIAALHVVLLNVVQNFFFLLQSDCD
jgi:hypothetical protein